MTRCFIFCHGWGFDQSYWNNLRPFFANEESIFLDLGYFGNEILPSCEKQKKYIGIGHSIGFQKLLSLPIEFSHLISLQGFTNFLGNDQKLRAAKIPNLKAMENYFQQAPEQTLNMFYKTAGFTGKLPAMAKMNKEKLAEDLALLHGSTTLPRHSKILAIGSYDDQTVAPEIIADNFASLPNVTIDMLETGKHCLGFLQPEIVYQKTIEFIGK